MLHYIENIINIVNSPFSGLKFKLYFGPITIGHPYFLPRRMVKSKNSRYLTPVYITKFGIDYNWLGWKIKFGQYRFEWNPSFSIIFLGKQFNLTILPKIPDNLMVDPYWEAWLYWSQKTDESLTISDRLKQLFEQYNCTWNNNSGKIDYYYYILKNSYIPFYQKWLEEKDLAFQKAKKRIENIESIIK